MRRSYLQRGRGARFERSGSARIAGMTRSIPVPRPFVDLVGLRTVGSVRHAVSMALHRCSVAPMGSVADPPEEASSCAPELAGVHRIRCLRCADAKTFSMFPSKRPGLALLLMRVALAVMLMDGVTGRVLSLGSAWFLLAPGMVAFALCFGLVTPVASALSVILEIAAGASSDGPVHALDVCAVLNAIAVFMLGPGAYSLDARLFGRRQVVIRSDRRHDERN